MTQKTESPIDSPSPRTSMNGMSGAIRSPPPPVAPKPAHISPRPSNDAPVSPVKPERQQSEQQNGEKVEDIDEKRLNRKAYDYLCRLSEVRNWLVECLRDDSISPATTLERALQNGVLLARIANFFAPDVVPTTAIYDLDQNKYETRLAADPENPENALVYRHTDNIVLWRKGLESIRLPEILIPETADVYEGRNAKTVFCLYALARQLHRMRRAPPIRNVAGKAIFTNDELDEVMDRVKELPEFSDVGSYLGGGSRKQEDDEIVREAMNRIEEAVRNKDKDALLSGLQNVNAQLLFVEVELIDRYEPELVESLTKNGNLSRKSVQEIITNTNINCGLQQLEEILKGGETSTSRVLDALMWLQFEDSRESAVPLYISLLKKSLDKHKNLDRELVDKAIKEGNALLEVKLAALHGNSHDSLIALKNPVLSLETNEENAALYHNRLVYNYEKRADDFFLMRTDLENLVFDLNDMSPEQRKILEVRGALRDGDREILSSLLTQLYPDFFIHDHLDFYLKKLHGKEDQISGNELRIIMEETNQSVSNAYETAELLVIMNDSLIRGDGEKAGATLQVLSTREPDEFTSFRQDFIKLYVEYLIEEITTRTPKKTLKIGEGAQPEQEEWFWHDFSLGTISVEINEKKFAVGKREPKKNGYIDGNELNKVFFEQNLAEEERQKREIEENQSEGRRNEAAATIQHGYKSWKHKKDHDLLWSSEAPSLSLVRKFLPSQTEQTAQIDEQIAIEEQKSEVTQLLAANHQLDGHLQELDEKIGLLIKNRINLQEVVAHKQKIHDSADKFQLRQFTLKKKEKELTDRLGQLFFALQAEPHLLANLLLAANPEKREGVITKIIAPVFGHLSENREQYLAVGLLCELLLKGVESSLSPEDVISSKPLQIVSLALGNELFSPLVSQITQGHVVDDLREFLQEQGKIEAFNLNPDEIYLSIYGQKPTDTNAAVQCPHVEQVLESSKSFLAHWSERLSESITKGHKLTKGLRFVCLSFQSSLRAKFPATSAVLIDKIIAQFVYESVIRAQLHSLEALKGIIGKDVPEDAQRKLEALLTFIGFAVANKGYGSVKWYLTSLNRQIHTIHEGFRGSISKQLGEESAERLFGLNRFTHFDPAHKPSLSILGSELKRVIEYVHKHHKEMSTDEVFTKLSKACKSPHDSEADRILILHLHPPSWANEATESHELFVRTKRQLVELLLSGVQGGTVSELINASISEENEHLHLAIFAEGASLKEVQASAKENLEKLAKEGRSNKEDDYQTLVTDIANDIRLATRRRKERAEQQQSLDETRKRLETQRGELKERLSHYEEYLDTCLENLSRNSKRLSFRPTSGKAEKIHKVRMSTDTKEMSYKASGDKLHKKGILWTVDRYEHKFSKLSFIIQGTENKGIFKISITDGKELNLQGDLDLQDLLQAEYSEEHDYRFVDVVVFKTSPLIVLLNKKFYDK